MAVRQVAVRLDDDLIASIDVARGGEGRNAWVGRALRHMLRCPYAAAPTPSTGRSVKDFEGSVIPGHRDVPELGWYRPTSAEAKAGVKVDEHMLRLAREAAGGG